MKKFFFLFLFLLSSLLASGQNTEWNGTFIAAGLVSTEESIPFWMHSNTSRRWGNESQFSGLGELNFTYTFSDSSNLKIGSAFFYRNNFANELQRRDLFVEYNHKWFQAIVGSKEVETELQGLSSTNKNFLFSRNARPLAGILLKSPSAVPLFKSFSLDWELAHYNLNDDRYTKDTFLHYKRVTLNVELDEKSTISGSIQHYAQWGGVSPDFGAFPDDFRAFVKVFFASKGAETFEDDELQNALGNHLGSYLFEYNRKTALGDLLIYHEHPFEDGSGTRGINVPDGVYGIHFKPKSSRFIDGILYEFVTTADQSGIDGGRGYDNYFANNLYRSGWTYEGNIIGLPFILLAEDRVLTSENNPILSNSLNLHHLGVTGNWKNFTWQILSSYVIQKGTLRAPLEPELKIWSNYGSLQYDLKEYGFIRLFGGLDSGKRITDIAAVGLEYGYSF